MSETLTDADITELEQFSFGDGPELADALLALVLAGTKTATCWSARDGQVTEVGRRWVARDGQGRARAVLETTALARRRFSDVDAGFAAKEGEGDRTLAWWRDAHQRYFTRNGGFDPAMDLWCEEFRLVATIALSDMGGRA